MKTARSRVSNFDQFSKLAAATISTMPNGEARVVVSRVPRFRHRVLVVDDEPDLSDIAARMLQFEGYDVVTAADGLEGLDALSRALPEVIIADLNMPRMSGFEFLAIVRKRFPHVGTIAMTGNYSAGEKSAAILADFCLQKGVQPMQELLPKVATLVATPPSRPRVKMVSATPRLPRDSSGILVLDCPKCLRSTKVQASHLDGGIHQAQCASCRETLRFEIDHGDEPSPETRQA